MRQFYAADRHVFPLRQPTGLQLLVLMMLSKLAAALAGHGPALLTRGCRQLARIQVTIAIGILLVETLDQGLALLFATDRRALATGQFVAAQHAVSIGIHAVKGVQHPLHVLLPADAPIAVGIHALQVTCGIADLCPCNHGQQQ